MRFGIEPSLLCPRQKILFREDKLNRTAGTPSANAKDGGHQRPVNVTLECWVGMGFKTERKEAGKKFCAQWVIDDSPARIHHDLVMAPLPRERNNRTDGATKMPERNRRGNEEKKRKQRTIHTDNFRKEEPWLPGRRQEQGRESIRVHGAWLVKYSEGAL